MNCDHDATRASLGAFVHGTIITGVQDFGDGTFALAGNCKRCKSTLMIQIEKVHDASERGPVPQNELEWNDPRIT